MNSWLLGMLANFRIKGFFFMCYNPSSSLCVPSQFRIVTHKRKTFVLEIWQLYKKMEGHNSRIPRPNKCHIYVVKLQTLGSKRLLKKTRKKIKLWGGWCQRKGQGGDQCGANWTKNMKEVQIWWTKYKHV